MTTYQYNWNGKWQRIRDQRGEWSYPNTGLEKARKCRISFHHAGEKLYPGRFKMRNCRLIQRYGDRPAYSFASIWYGVDSKMIKFNWVMSDESLFF